MIAYFELLALRYGADLSAKKIAEVLDSTPGAVRVALNRAHARLRVVLEDRGYEARREPLIRVQPAP